MIFRWQYTANVVQVMTELDWARNRATRTRTNGTVVIGGRDDICVVVVQCRMHKRVALSSGGAELSAQILGITEGLAAKFWKKKERSDMPV